MLIVLMLRWRHMMLIGWLGRRLGLHRTGIGYGLLLDRKDLRARLLLRRGRLNGRETPFQGGSTGGVIKSCGTGLSVCHASEAHIHESVESVESVEG